MEELLAKYFANETSDNERSLVESWRSESKENAKAFFDAKIFWLESGPQVANRPDILTDILGENERSNHFIIQHSWLKYAAAAVLIAAIGLLFILNNSGDTETYFSKTLADGTIVALHEGAFVESTQFDEGIRQVKLTGMAYFDVKRDESRPFIIHTENATVKVLGTSFLINATNDGTEVCVESGLVQLIKDDEKISVNLEQGKMGLILNTNEGIIKKENENLNYLSWKTKILTFKNNEMNYVGKTLEQVYGIKVKFSNPDLNHCQLTAKFKEKKPKDAIEIIARTFNLEYDFDGETVLFKGSGC